MANHRHATETAPDPKLTVESYLKLKGYSPKPEAGTVPLGATLSIQDQHLIRTNNPEKWGELHEEIQKHQDEAIAKAADLDEKMREEELKLLKVKRYDEPKVKPAFLCVVPGCGEPKALGQNNHCQVHCKSV